MRGQWLTLRLLNPLVRVGEGRLFWCPSSRLRGFRTDCSQSEYTIGSGFVPLHTLPRRDILPGDTECSLNEYLHDVK